MEQDRKEKAEHEASSKSLNNIATMQFDDATAWLSKIANANQHDTTWRDRKDSVPFFKIKEPSTGIAIWYKVEKKGDRPPVICIPNDPDIKRTILNEFHAPPSIGHFMRTKMMEKLRNRFYWKGMDDDCKRHCDACHICKRNKPYRRSVGYIAPYQKPHAPWSSVALDFVGPLPHSKNKDDFVLVAVCRLTKMVHFIPCKTSITSQELADLYIDRIYSLHGLADEYRSDRDTRFDAKFWKHLWSRLGTSLAMSTAYRHQTAGDVERIIADLRVYLRIYSENHHDWANHLGLAAYAHNSTTHASTQHTPFMLQYGYEPKSITDMLAMHAPELPADADSDTKTNKERRKIAHEWLQKKEEAIIAAQKALATAYEKRAVQYNRKHAKPDMSRFQPGSKVYLSTADFTNLETIGHAAGVGDREKRKMMPLFIGPYEVLENSGPGKLNCKLKIPQSMKDGGIHDVFHISKLRPAHTDKKGFNVTDATRPPRIDKDGNPLAEEEYYIDKILAHEDLKYGRLYYVSWLGYDESFNEWIEEENLANAQETLHQYLKSRPQPANHMRLRSRSDIKLNNIRIDEFYI